MGHVFKVVPSILNGQRSKMTMLPHILPCLVRSMLCTVVCSCRVPKQKQKPKPWVLEMTSFSHDCYSTTLLASILALDLEQHN